MAAWSDGYVTDVQYTDKFYAELAPGFLAFACLRQGVRPPSLEAGSTYLELGCGQGFGLNLLAAANPGMDFWGVDFHPGQIDNARRLARAAGLTNIVFEDYSFEQMLALPAAALPKFDIIALHGVYSWVSPENRAVIVQLLDRLLKPGGMVYVSYNCLPGWAALAPLQRFVAEFVDRAPGPPKVEILNAFRAAQQMLQSDGGFFGSVPLMGPRIAETLKQDPVYLIHEYLNDHSRPHYHADVAREMEGARLSFAASANVADDMPHLAAPAALQPMIQAAGDPVWRETLLDYAGNKPFRRDVFVRGRNAPGRLEREAMLDDTRFTLLVAPEAATFEIPVPIGQLKGQPAIYQPIVDALAEGPLTYGDLRNRRALLGAREGAVLQALILLVNSRQVHPVIRQGVTDAAAPRFNRAVADRARFGEVSSYIAAPLAGTAVRVDLVDLLALGAALRGVDDVAQAAREGWEVMAATGRRLLKDGRTLDDQAGNEAELAARVATFNRTKLPMLRGLGAV
ncbi:MAG: class I SAM-dependent methyltransferase [Phenylobacterium sp.]|uniref:class I SAM-dependent methyltransferase n=1 Tax=Phenylobacterium sp. TaxID=1871053 RepID=UPI002735FE88|nr:class I SAM-dependent methyltransferase [Phenylobacterium sp.]MDP3173605.1 class I SAM-dependent methyltransferase [Phenylobacterium sp.]